MAAASAAVSCRACRLCFPFISPSGPGPEAVRPGFLMEYLEIENVIKRTHVHELARDHQTR
jgi:hypothetical protein